MILEFDLTSDGSILMLIYFVFSHIYIIHYVEK